jgi:hypothetical protein
MDQNILLHNITFITDLLAIIEYVMQIENWTSLLNKYEI